MPQEKIGEFTFLHNTRQPITANNEKTPANYKGLNTNIQQKKEKEIVVRRNDKHGVSLAKMALRIWHFLYLIV